MSSVDSSTDNVNGETSRRGQNNGAFNRTLSEAPPITPLDASRQHLPHQIRINDDDLDFLFLHLLRVPSLFLEAQQHLRVDLFEQTTEPHYAVLWVTAKEQYEQYGRFTYESLSNGIMNHTRAIPDLMTTSMQTELLQPDLSGIIYSCMQVAEQELMPDLARETLRKFLRERLVIHPMRAILNQANGQAYLQDITSVLRTANEQIAAIDRVGTPICVSVRDLSAAHPQLRDQIIHGMLRRGETGNIVSGSKIGKSWLAHMLALSVATGRQFLGRFQCQPGRVLLIDNELHPDTIADRLRRVAGAMNIPAEEYDSALEVMSLRGKLLDLPQIATLLKSAQPGDYQLIVLDAWYRSLPAGVDENSNRDIMAQYNLIDSITARLGCGWVNVHHASKGNQSEKSVSDVGAGAGVRVGRPTPI